MKSGDDGLQDAERINDILAKGCGNQVVYICNVGYKTDLIAVCDDPRTRRTRLAGGGETTGHRVPHFGNNIEQTRSESIGEFDEREHGSTARDT